MYWAKWFFGLMLVGAVGALSYAQTNPNFVAGQVLTSAQLNSVFSSKADFPLPLVSLTTGVTGVLPLQNGGTGTTVFTAGNPLIGAGTLPVTQGARSGNTTTFATVSGAFVAGNCTSHDASGNLIDSGAACGGGGGGGSPGAPNMSVQFNNLSNFAGSANFTWDGTGITLGQSGTLSRLIIGNATSGTITLQPTTGPLGAATLSLPAATDTLMGKATSDIMTNKTYDTGGTGNNLSIAGVAVTSNTGTGAVARQVSPVFTTPNIGAATATTVNGLTITSTTGGTLTVTNNKTASFSNTLTFAGNDGSTIAFPTGSPVAVAALNLTGQLVTGGANVTSLAQSSGSLALDFGVRPQQYIPNVGAFTLTAPASLEGAASLKVINLSGAGAVTFADWSKMSPKGDTFATAATSSSTVTITNASPGIVSWASHTLVAGTIVYFTTTGTLPTGLSPSPTFYYVCKGGTLQTNSFAVATTRANAIAGTCVNTSSAGSGTHTALQASVFLLSAEMSGGLANASWMQVQ